jgi:predicted glycosyltransferase
MTTRNVLFISGRIGLGHVTRDLAIAAALRARCPDIRIVWLAGRPAQRALQAAGETLVPECERYADDRCSSSRLPADSVCVC